jgi:hypothetical protein
LFAENSDFAFREKAPILEVIFLNILSELFPFFRLEKKAFSFLFFGIFIVTYLARYIQLARRTIIDVTGIRWNNGLITIVTIQFVAGNWKFHCNEVVSSIPMLMAYMTTRSSTSMAPNKNATVAVNPLNVVQWKIENLEDFFVDVNLSFGMLFRMEYASSH